jgi:hypothetical protein
LPYPASLLDRLSKDTEVLDSTLAASSAASLSVPAAKDLAQRQLLAATPRAIDKLKTLMDSGNEKVELGAASKILDISPATASELTAGGQSSIPAEAMASLISSLSTFAQAAIQSAAAYAGVHPQGAPLATDDAPTDPYANIRSALEPKTKIVRKKKSESDFPSVRITPPKEKK